MSTTRFRAFTFGPITAAFAAAISLACGQSGPGGGSGGSSAAAGTGGRLGSGGTTGGTNPGAGVTSSGGSGATGAVSSSGGTGGTGGTAGSGGVPSSTGGAGGSIGGTGGNAGSSSSAGGATGAQGGGPSTGGMVGTGGASAGSGSGGSAQGGMSGGAGAAACAPPTVTLSGANAVAGTLITFNDNGGWCWYQDERALVDTKANKLLIGSVASNGSRNGYVEATIYDLATKQKQLYTVSKETKLVQNVDDHNSPAFVIRPDGHYFAQYAGHRIDCLSRFSIFDGTAWSAEKTFDWGPLGCPWAGADTNMITYSNPWYLGTALYSAVRSVDTDPAVISSSDDGQSWAYTGKLASSPQLGYVAGYFKYWGNNSDRLDFIGTEAHPRNNDNNLWHGYVQNGMVYDSKGGTAIDMSLKDPSSSMTNAKDISSYTPVFKTRTMLNGVELSHAWDIDLVRYADDTIGVLWQARANWTGNDKDSSGTTPDDRLLYARFDGNTWSLTYLVKGGKSLYADEEDYMGLGALDPDDPTTIYVSSAYDPSTDMMGSSGKREIWRGTTCDHGATFKWTPVTANSTKDNIRPIIPKWDTSHQALLWLQGSYTSAQNYNLAIVGLITDR